MGIVDISPEVAEDLANATLFIGPTNADNQVEIDGPQGYLMLRKRAGKKGEPNTLVEMAVKLYSFMVRSGN